MLKIAIAGAGGIGQHILSALLKTDKYELIILSRKTHPDLAKNPKLTTHEVDYANPSTLTKALHGVHTLICAIASFDPETQSGTQIALINACLSCGVSRFIPSEFEGTPLRRKGQMGYQVAKDKVLQYLRELPESPGLEWTSITTGVFQDFYAPKGKGSASLTDIGFDLLVGFGKGEGKVLVEDDGREVEERIAFTSADDVGRVVAKVLELEKWPREVRACGSMLTPRELVEMGERVLRKPFNITKIPRSQLLGELKQLSWKKDSIDKFAVQGHLLVADGEFGWTPGDEGTAEFKELFPEEKLRSLEESLMLWYGDSENA